MGILAWIVVGLIAGILAKIAMPGPDPGGIIIDYRYRHSGSSDRRLRGQQPAGRSRGDKYKPFVHPGGDFGLHHLPRHIPVDHTPGSVRPRACSLPSVGNGSGVSL